MSRKSARRSVCFCNHNGGGASIRVISQQLQSCDRGRGIVMFVKLALKGVMQNGGDFVDVVAIFS